MTLPNPYLSQEILSAASERYVRGDSPFDLRLLIIEEAWKRAKRQERDDVGTDVYMTIHSGLDWSGNTAGVRVDRGDGGPCVEVCIGAEAIHLTADNARTLAWMLADAAGQIAPESR